MVFAASQYTITTWCPCVINTTTEVAIKKTETARKGVGPKISFRAVATPVPASLFHSNSPLHFSTKKKTAYQPITAFLINKIYWNSSCD